MSSRKAMALAVGIGTLLLVVALWFLPKGGDERLEVERGAGASAGDDAGEKAGPRPVPGRKVAVTDVVVVPDAGAPRAAEVWVRAGWGSGPGQLGRERRQEGNAEGPMSILATAGGGVLVLDQANGRIARFDPDGKPKDTVAIPVQSAQELAQTKDGKTLVLDRLADSAVAILDKEGKVVGELPLLGETVKEGGAVTGMFVDGEDVYVEQEHGALVRIGDTSGKRDEQQPEIPGRPTRDGRSYLSAGIVDHDTGRLYVTAIDRQAMAQRFTRELRLPPRLLAIVLLDTDASGIIYLATLLEPPEGKPGVQLVCLDPLDGRPVGSAALPANTLPEETFRDFAVLDQGGVVYSYRTEEGVELRRYECR